MTQETILLALFISLSSFVVINLALSAILWKYSKYPIYKKIVKYWAATITFFAFQFFFPHTPLQIALAYGFGLLPMLYVYTLVYELFGIETRTSRFVIFHLLAVAITITFSQQELGFTAMALPMSLSLALPLLFAIKTIFNHRSQATVLQRLLGILLIVWIPHCFTFSFFRMIEGAQVVGWITSYSLYDIMAILLPAIAIEDSYRTEKIRLERQVKERTEELSHALSDKETLLKILIHDISNPLTVMRWYLMGIKKNTDHNFHTYIDKVLKSQEIVETIVKEVRVLQTVPNLSKVAPVSFSKSIEEIHFVFEKALLAKNINLEVIDETDSSDLIMADQFSLTHNVLSNFINNAIKFSFPNSNIKIIISKKDQTLQVQIKDSGLGMSEEVIRKVLSDQKVESSPGTQGEDGTGFGLSIARSLLKDFNACLDIKSQEYSSNSTDHGTTISLVFPLIKSSNLS